MHAPRQGLDFNVDPELLASEFDDSFLKDLAGNAMDASCVLASWLALLILVTKLKAASSTQDRVSDLPDILDVWDMPSKESNCET